MKPSLLYRIAAVLLVLFAVGHTLGFRLTDPQLGVGPVVSLMQTIHFTVQGFGRTYWDFYVGFGLFVSVFLLFAAFVAWQLGGMPANVLPRMRGITWGLAVSFAVLIFLSWRYFFAVPVAFSIVITACLGAAAWLSGERRPARGSGQS